MEKLTCKRCGREVAPQDYTTYDMCVDCYIEESIDRTEQEARENCR